MFRCVSISRAAAAAEAVAKIVSVFVKVVL